MILLMLIGLCHSKITKARNPITHITYLLVIGMLLFSVCHKTVIGISSILNCLMIDLQPIDGVVNIFLVRYGTASSPPKCSGFYHDQEQTPEHIGGGKDYPVDGECMEQCDCGATNPCGEYIFNHRNASFSDW